MTWIDMQTGENQADGQGGGQAQRELDEQLWAELQSLRKRSAKSYEGKPACERCRAKRTRCDRGSPECKKCVKAGTPCNYDPSSLMRRGPPSAKEKKLLQERGVKLRSLQNRHQPWFHSDGIHRKNSQSRTSSHSPSTSRSPTASFSASPSVESSETTQPWDAQVFDATPIAGPSSRPMHGRSASGNDVQGDASTRVGSSTRPILSPLETLSHGDDDSGVNSGAALHHGPGPVSAVSHGMLAPPWLESRRASDSSLLDAHPPSWPGLGLDNSGVHRSSGMPHTRLDMLGDGGALPPASTRGGLVFPTLGESTAPFSRLGGGGLHVDGSTESLQLSAAYPVTSFPPMSSGVHVPTGSSMPSGSVMASVEHHDTPYFSELPLGQLHRPIDSQQHADTMSSFLQDVSASQVAPQLLFPAPLYSTASSSTSSQDFAFPHTQYPNQNEHQS